MKIRPLPLILLFSLLIPLLSLAEEYVLRQSHMREVTPVELKSTCDTDSTEIYYVSSAPLTDRDYPTIVYDYPDSAIVSDYGFLTTFRKCGGDTIVLSSVENRVLRLSPTPESSPVFVRGLTIPKCLEFAAYAEQPGKDTLDVRIEARVVPKGRATLIIDSDTIGFLRLTDRYMSVHIPDSIARESVWLRETTEWTAGDSRFPILREITDSHVADGDTVVSPTLTLLAASETVEEAVAESKVRRRNSDAPDSPVILLEAERVSSDELLVSFATGDNEEGAVITVHDILGRQLAAPRQADASPALSQIRVHLSSPMPGVCFVSLLSASGTETVKIMQ